MAKKETVILEFEADANDAVVSIEKLTKANKELREERKKVDLSTDEGVKRVKAINEQLDKNNDIIKNNSSTLEKNRLNVGNYTESIKAAAPALDKFTGGLYSASQGFVEMAKGALAFIATPIGAIISAVGLAIGALISYFKGSEEGQNRLNKIVAIGTGIFETFMNVVESIGGAIYDAFTNPKEALIELYKFVEQNLINRFTAFGVILDGILNLDFKKITNGVIQMGTGIENSIEKVEGLAKTTNDAIKQSVKDSIGLAELEAKIDAQERELIEKRAQTRLQVAKLRQQADESEGQAKRDLIATAIELELELGAAELEQHQLKQERAAERVAMYGDDKEALKELAEANAALNDAEAQALENTRKLNKERIELDRKLLDDLEKAQFESQLKKLRSQETYGKNTLDNATKSLDDQIVQIKIKEPDFAAAQKSVQDTVNAETKKGLEINAKQWAENVQNIAGVVQEQVNGLSSLFDQYYENQEAKLALSLANQKTQLQSDYAEELKILDEKFAKGELSQDEYNAAVFALNEQLKADTKAAEIAQAKDLNEIKRKQFNTDKIKSLADIAIQTALGVSKAVAASPLTGGLPWSAAVAIVGAAQAALVAAQKFVPETFRTGGYTGDGDPDQIAGAVHKSEFVMPAETVAKYGKDHFQAYMDGTVVAGSMTAGMAPAGGGGQAPVYLNYTEFRKFVREVEMKEKLVTA